MSSEKARLTQQAANLLNKHGANVLCLEVPTKTGFGIDCLEFQVGDQFKGGKNKNKSKKIKSNEIKRLNNLLYVLF